MDAKKKLGKRRMQLENDIAVAMIEFIEDTGINIARVVAERDWHDGEWVIFVDADFLVPRYFLDT